MNTNHTPIVKQVEYSVRNHFGPLILACDYYALFAYAKTVSGDEKVAGAVAKKITNWLRKNSPWQTNSKGAA